MTNTRLLASCIAAAVAFIAAATAMAQSPPTRLRGSIAANDGKTVTIATREGTQVPVKLADNWGVMLVSPVSMADIKENSFVGIASMKGPDGSLNALEVLVFPEAARGTGEGHYPWDLQPESMMTNATVATVAKSPDGDVLTLKYKDGTQTIKVKPGTPSSPLHRATRPTPRSEPRCFWAPPRVPTAALRPAACWSARMERRRRCRTGSR